MASEKRVAKREGEAVCETDLQIVILFQSRPLKVRLWRLGEGSGVNREVVFVSI